MHAVVDPISNICWTTQVATQANTALRTKHHTMKQKAYRTAEWQNLSQLTSIVTKTKSKFNSGVYDLASEF